MTRRFQNGDNGDNFMKLFGEWIGDKQEEENDLYGDGRKLKRVWWPMLVLERRGWMISI